MSKFQLAIDGPAGAGKSSVSKEVAKRLGLDHIDTGAMYRAVTLQGLRLGIDFKTETDFTYVEDIDIDYKNNSIYLNGECVDKEIRTSLVANNVSVVAKQKIVRDKMVFIQKQIAENSNIVMDGRDIGYNVLPNADLKIFLNASLEIRAKRRLKDIQATGIDIELSELMKQIQERDEKDSTRKINPLKKAEDAIELDTTNMNVEQSVEAIISLTRKRDR